MPQFFVPRKNIRGRSFHFDPRESRHIAKVLRRVPGDTLQVFDGEGWAAEARIVDCSRPEQVRGEILEEFPPAVTEASGRPPSRFSLRIYPALIKGPRFEWLIEKATELGVQAIQPVLTRRTVAQPRAPSLEGKVRRWRKIILASAQQCGRRDLPALHDPVDFSAAMSKIGNDQQRVILWEREERLLLSSLIRGLAGAAGDSPIPIHLFTGPEGGFTVQEHESALKAGFVSAGLGRNILRAETAVLAAASLFLL